MSQRYQPGNRETGLAEGSVLGLGLISPWRNSPTLESLRSGTLSGAEGASSGLVHSTPPPLPSSGPLLASLLTYPGSSSNSRPSSSLLPPRHSGPRSSGDSVSWQSRSDEDERALNRHDRHVLDINLLSNISRDRGRPNSCNTSLLSVQLAAVVYQLRELCCELQQDSTTVWFDYRRCLQEEKKYLSDIRESRARAESAEAAMHQMQNSLAMYEEIERVRSKDDDRQQKSIEDLRKFLEKERQVRQEAEESQKRVVLMWAEKEDRLVRKVESLERELQQERDLAARSNEITQSYKKDLESEREKYAKGEQWMRKKNQEELGEIQRKLDDAVKKMLLAEQRLEESSRAFAAKSQAENIRMETELQKILALQRVADEERRERELAEEKLDGLRSQIMKEIKRREQAEDMVQVVTQTFQLQIDSQKLKIADECECRQALETALHEERRMRESAEQSMIQLAEQKRNSEKLRADVNANSERETLKLREEREASKLEIQALRIEAARERDTRMDIEESLKANIKSMLSVLCSEQENYHYAGDSYKHALLQATKSSSSSDILVLLKKSYLALLEAGKASLEDANRNTQKYSFENENLRAEVEAEKERRQKAEDSIVSLRESASLSMVEGAQLQSMLDIRNGEALEFKEKTVCLEEKLKSLTVLLDLERNQQDKKQEEQAKLDEDINDLRIREDAYKQQLKLSEEALKEIKLTLEARDAEMAALKADCTAYKKEAQLEREESDQLRLVVQKIDIERGEDIRREGDAKARFQSEVERLQKLLAEEKVQKDLVEQMMNTERENYHRLAESERLRAARLESTIQDAIKQKEDSDNVIQQLKVNWNEEQKKKKETFALALQTLRLHLDECMEMSKDASCAEQEHHKRFEMQSKEVQRLKECIHNNEVKMLGIESQLLKLRAEYNGQCERAEREMHSLQSLLDEERNQRTHAEEQARNSAALITSMKENEEIRVENERSIFRELEGRLLDEKRKTESATSQLLDLIKQHRSLSAKEQDLEKEKVDMFFNVPSLGECFTLENAISGLEDCLASMRTEVFHTEHQLILKSVAERSAAENLRVEMNEQGRLLQSSEASVKKLQAELSEYQDKLECLQAENMKSTEERMALVERLQGVQQESAKQVQIYSKELEAVHEELTYQTQNHSAQSEALRSELHEARKRKEDCEHNLISAKQQENLLKAELEQVLKESSRQRERADEVERHMMNLKQQNAELEMRANHEMSLRTQMEVELENLRVQLFEESREREDADEKLQKGLQNFQTQINAEKERYEFVDSKREEFEGLWQKEKLLLEHAHQEVEALHCLIASEISRKERAEEMVQEAQRGMSAQKAEIEKLQIRLQNLNDEFQEQSGRAARCEGALSQLKADLEHERAKNEEIEARTMRKAQDEINQLRNHLSSEIRKGEQTDALLQAARQTIAEQKNDLEKLNCILQNVTADAREQCERAAKAEGALEQMKNGKEAEQVRLIQEEQMSRKRAENEIESLRMKILGEVQKSEKSEKISQEIQLALQSKALSFENLVLKMEDQVRMFQKQASMVHAAEAALRKLQNDLEKARLQRSCDEQRVHEKERALSTSLEELSQEKIRCQQTHEQLEIITKAHECTQRELENAVRVSSDCLGRQEEMSVVVRKLQEQLEEEQKRSEAQQNKIEKLTNDEQKERERALRFKESLQQLKLDIQLERSNTSLELRRAQMQYQKELDELVNQNSVEVARRQGAERILEDTEASIVIQNERAARCEESLAHLRDCFDREIQQMAAETRQLQSATAEAILEVNQQLEQRSDLIIELQEQLLQETELRRHDSTELATLRQQIETEISQREYSDNALQNALKTLERVKQDEEELHALLIEQTRETEDQQAKASYFKVVLHQLQAELEAEQKSLAQKTCEWSRQEASIIELCDKIVAAFQQEIQEREEMKERCRNAKQNGEHSHPVLVCDERSNAMNQVAAARMEMEAERELRRTRDALYSNMQSELCSLKEKLRQTEILKDAAEAQLTKQKSEFEEQLENVIHACVAEEIVSEESRKREAEALAKLSLSYSRALNGSTSFISNTESPSMLRTPNTSQPHMESSFGVECDVVLLQGTPSDRRAGVV